MKQQIVFPVILLLVTMTFIVKGQDSKPKINYVDYNAWFGDALRSKFQSGNSVLVEKTIKEMHASAKLLTDEKALTENIQTLKNNTRVLEDEAIFSKRKNGVFVVGILHAASPKSVNSLNFEMTGTAFAISANGICVTNYHMLKDLIKSSTDLSKDSIYFIIGADKKVYLIDSVLAFSKNNDLAIFKINTQGDRLSPIPLGKPADIGAAIYCISNPQAHFYSFTKGIVARNVIIDSLNVTEGYDKNGRTPIRMEITADYGVGSSGGPILDKYGNLVGVVVSTYPIIGTPENGAAYTQMVVKETSPVKALYNLLGK